MKHFGENGYSVDELGNIFMHNGKPKAKHIDVYGYEYIILPRENSKHGKKKLVHRIVAEAFIPNPEHKPQVNHIDGNKRNNSVSNLEWCDNSYNQTHSRYVLGNVTGFEDVSVECIESGEVYRSTRDAWRATGVGYSHISECINGKRKSAGGLHWRRIE